MYLYGRESYLSYTSKIFYFKQGQGESGQRDNNSGMFSICLSTLYCKLIKANKPMSLHI